MEDMRRNFSPKFIEGRAAGSKTCHGASTPSTTKHTIFRIRSQVLSQPPQVQTSLQYLRPCEQVLPQAQLMQLGRHSLAQQEVIHPKSPVQVTLSAENSVILLSRSSNRDMASGSAIPFGAIYKSMRDIIS